VEAAPGLDRGADDDELRPALRGKPRHVLPEAPRARADDLPPHADAVRARHGSRGLEPLLQAAELSVETGIERQLACDDERRDEHDAGASIGREPAGELEGVLRLLPFEQGHEDAPIRDRLRPQHEVPRAPVEPPEIGPPHRSSW
jgi:hypothetical protein